MGQGSIAAMASISELWVRWEAWLSENAPSLLRGLGAPATDAEIAAAEKALEVELPESLKQLYRLEQGRWPIIHTVIVGQ